MSDSRILIAGIGNIFWGDDAFGVIVAQQLAGMNLPAEVRVMDFGIRSYDLAFAMMEHDVTILVDATQQGDVPGTLYVMQPTLEELETLEGQIIDGHSMNPLSALQMVRTFGGQCNQLYLVGCEPATLISDDGSIGLSAALDEAADEAVNLILELVEGLLNETNSDETHLKEHQEVENARRAF